MATYITGEFKDNLQRTVSIRIVSPNGQKEYDLNDDNSPIKIAYDSIDIEYDIEDLFQHIIKTRMSLKLATKIYLGDIIFTSKAKEVTVEVKRDDETIFKGYVEPYTYSQEYVDVWEEFELNCIDDLGILEYEYLTQHENWYEVSSQQDPITFKQYLSLMLPQNTYYDMSKKKNGQSVFDKVAVSMKPFLGDSQDDMLTNEETLDEILRYLNLHIIQIKGDLYIFDWNSLKNASSNQTFVNIFDSTLTKTIDLSKQQINKDSYKDDSTNISMSDVYNQIQLKCDLDTIDSVVGDPLDSDFIQYYSNYKQMWYSEYVSAGEGRDAHNAYHSIIQQGYEHYNQIIHDYDAWYREDWYFKLAYNPLWKLMWNGIDVDEWVEKDSQGNAKNLQRIFEVMKNYRFFPFLVSAGKCEERLNNKNKDRLSSLGGVKGKISMAKYFIVSVNGNLDDSKEEYDRIQAAINKSAQYIPSSEVYKGLMTYDGQTNLNLSPQDDETVNYLVFKGKIALNPVRRESGWATYTGGYGQVWATSYKESAPDILFEDIYQAAKSGVWEHTVGVSDNGDGGLYAQQYYTCETPGGEEVSAPKKLMIYPFVGEKAAQELEYNYSGHWDSEDKIDKLPIFECELKIGDKYLVETYTNGDKQKPVYGWYTEVNLPIVEGIRKRTFSIGIDPAINDKIVGKEYEISNTVNGRISDESGMAIPIKKSDALSGKVSFKIICVVNQQWNEITRRHPTLFRSTKYYDNWKNLWSHVSSIWMKDFEIGIFSDNKGSDVSDNEQDLVYISNEVKDVINKRDDLELKICTKPTTEELIQLGIDTNTATNNTIDVDTNEPLDTIVDLSVSPSQSERPERMYIDQYWGIYSQPKCIIETGLSDSYSNIRVKNFSMFGDTIPLSIRENLQKCMIETKLQQI